MAGDLGKAGGMRKAPVAEPIVGKRPGGSDAPASKPANEGVRPGPVGGTNRGAH